PRGQAASELDPAVDDDSVVEDEDGDERIEAANDYRPSSAALSFIHTASSVHCTVAFATYAKVRVDDHDEWQRNPSGAIHVSLDANTPVRNLDVAGAQVRVHSR